MKALVEQKRIARLKEVRQQEKEAALLIREKVKKKKDKQLKKLTAEIQREFEEDKENHLNILEEEYQKRVKQIGRAHQLSGKENYGEKQELSEKALSDAKRRYKLAQSKVIQEKAAKNASIQQQEDLRSKVHEMEANRKESILALPKQSIDVISNLKPVRVCGVSTTRDTAESFLNTRYHLGESGWTTYPEVLVEKVREEDQVDAREAADEEESRRTMAKEIYDREIEERKEKAEIRHLYARHDVILKQEKDALMEELKVLELKDRNTRCETLKNIPKKVFQPPYQRYDDVKLRRMQLEHAFENIYNVKAGDIAEIQLPVFIPEKETSEEASQESMNDSDAEKANVERPSQTFPSTRLCRASPVELADPRASEEAVGGETTEPVHAKIVRECDRPKILRVLIDQRNGLTSQPQMRTENDSPIDSLMYMSIESAAYTSSISPSDDANSLLNGGKVNQYVQTRLSNLRNQQLINQDTSNLSELFVDNQERRNRPRVKWSADAIQPVDIVMSDSSPGLISKSEGSTVIESEASRVILDDDNVTSEETVEVTRFSPSLSRSTITSINISDTSNSEKEYKPDLTDSKPTQISQPIQSKILPSPFSASTSTISASPCAEQELRQDPDDIQTPEMDSLYKDSSEGSTVTEESVGRSLSKTMSELREVRAKKEELRKDYSSLIEKMQSYRKELKEKDNRFVRRQTDNRLSQISEEKSDNIDFNIEREDVSHPQFLKQFPKQSNLDSSLSEIAKLDQAIPKKPCPQNRKQTNLEMSLLELATLNGTMPTPLTPLPSVPPSSQYSNVVSIKDDDISELSDVADSVLTGDSLLDLSHPEINDNIYRVHSPNKYAEADIDNVTWEDMPSVSDLSTFNSDMTDSELASLYLKSKRGERDLYNALFDHNNAHSTTSGLSSVLMHGGASDDFKPLRHVESPSVQYQSLHNNGQHTSDGFPEIGKVQCERKVFGSSTHLPINDPSHRPGSFDDKASSYYSSSIMSLQEQRLSMAVVHPDTADDGNKREPSPHSKILSPHEDSGIISPPSPVERKDPYIISPPYSIESNDPIIISPPYPIEKKDSNILSPPYPIESKDSDIMSPPYPVISKDSTTMRSSYPIQSKDDYLLSCNSSSMMSLKEQTLSAAVVAFSDTADDGDVSERSVKKVGSDVNALSQETDGDVLSDMIPPPYSSPLLTQTRDPVIPSLSGFISLHDNMESVIDRNASPVASTCFFPLISLPTGEQSIVIPEKSLLETHDNIPDSTTLRSTQSELRISNFETATQSSLRISHLDNMQQSASDFPADDRVNLNTSVHPSANDIKEPKSSQISISDLMFEPSGLTFSASPLPRSQDVHVTSPEFHVISPIVRVTSPTSRRSSEPVNQISPSPIQEGFTPGITSEIVPTSVHVSLPAPTEKVLPTQSTLPDLDTNLNLPRSKSQLDFAKYLSKPAIVISSPTFSRSSLELSSEAIAMLPQTTMANEISLSRSVESLSDSLRYREQLHNIEQLSAKYRSEQKKIIESYEKLREDILTDSSPASEVISIDLEDRSHSIPTTHLFADRGEDESSIIDSLEQVDVGKLTPVEESFLRDRLSANVLQDSAAGCNLQSISDVVDVEDISPSESPTEPCAKNFMSFFRGLTTPEMTLLGDTLLDSETLPSVSLTDNSYRSLPALRKLLESLSQSNSLPSSRLTGDETNPIDGIEVLEPNPTEIDEIKYENTTGESTTKVFETWRGVDHEHKHHGVGIERSGDHSYDHHEIMNDNVELKEDMSPIEEQKNKFYMSFFQGISPDATFPEITETENENISMFNFTQDSYRNLPGFAVRNYLNSLSDTNDVHVDPKPRETSSIAVGKRNESRLTNSRQPTNSTSFTHNTSAHAYISACKSTLHDDPRVLPGITSLHSADLTRHKDVQNSIEIAHSPGALIMDGSNSDGTISELLNLKLSSFSNDTVETVEPSNVNSSLKNQELPVKNVDGFVKERERPRVISFTVPAKSDSDTSELFTVGKLKLTGSSGKKKNRTKGIAKETLSLKPTHNGGHGVNKKSESSSSCTSATSGVEGTRRNTKGNSSVEGTARNSKNNSGVEGMVRNSKSNIETKEVKKRHSDGALKKVKHGNISQKGKKQVKFR